MLSTFSKFVSRVFDGKDGGSHGGVAAPHIPGMTPKGRFSALRRFGKALGGIRKDHATRERLCDSAERIGAALRQDVPCQRVLMIFRIGPKARYVGFLRADSEVREYFVDENDPVVSRVLARSEPLLVPFGSGAGAEKALFDLLANLTGMKVFSVALIPLGTGWATAGSARKQELPPPEAIAVLINRLVDGSDVRGNDASGGDQARRDLDLDGFHPSDSAKAQGRGPLLVAMAPLFTQIHGALELAEKAGDIVNSITDVARAKLDINQSVDAIIRAAMTVTRADRGTLWLVDHEACELYTTIVDEKGQPRELRLAIGDGYAGRCARDQAPVRIDYDLYRDPESGSAKQTDRVSGYRSCSLLCFPILTLDQKLFGVIQLVNKRKAGAQRKGERPVWPEAPPEFKCSFTAEDLEFLKVFSMLAGNALENALLFKTLKEQERRKDDLLSTLTEGVVSVDAQFRVITFNKVFERQMAIAGLRTGENVLDFVRPASAADAKSLSDFLSIASGSTSLLRLEGIEMLRKDGTLLTANMKVSRFAQPEGIEEPLGFVFAIEDLSRERRLKSAMARYMAKELVEKLSDRGEIDLGGVSAHVSVLFSDIRSYTSLVENMMPSEVVAMLNDYFGIVVEPILGNSGTLDKYIGDAVMAVFGAPVPLADHPTLACRAAVQMQMALRPFNEQRCARGLPPLETGIGVNTDTVVSGNIGTKQRMDYTAIGDGVNLGSRLESLTKHYGVKIIVSEATRVSAQHEAKTRWLDVITVKGKQEAVVIHELFGTESDGCVKSFPEGYLSLWDAFVTSYLKANFVASLALLDQLEALCPGDEPVRVFKQRINFLGEVGMSRMEDWNGVWRHGEK